MIFFLKRGYYHDILQLFSLGILSLFMVISLSCSAHERHYNIILHSDLKTEGFLSENLFQVKANGNAPIMENSLLKRRASAIELAYENSIERAIDFFIKKRIEKLQEKYPDRLVEIQGRYITEIRNKLRFYALNGDIIQKTFSSDGSCTILYRIYYQKLKNIVEKIKIPFFFKGLSPLRKKRRLRRAISF